MAYFWAPIRPDKAFPNGAWSRPWSLTSFDCIKAPPKVSPWYNLSYSCDGTFLCTVYINHRKEAPCKKFFLSSHGEWMPAAFGGQLYIKSSAACLFYRDSHAWIRGMVKVTWVLSACLPWTNELFSDFFWFLKNSYFLLIHCMSLHACIFHLRECFFVSQLSCEYLMEIKHET